MAKETIQTVGRTFLIMETLAANGSMGVRALHAATGFSVTAVHRMLSTLVEMGYAYQEEETEKYDLTYKVLTLGNAVAGRKSIAQLVHPHLEWLSGEINETVHFVERVQNNIRYLDKVVPTSGVVAMGSYVGMELPMYSTAVGKAIMADLPEDEVQRIWNESEIVRYTDHTISTLENLEQQLAQVRQSGCAFDREEREIGTFCVAIDVLDLKGKPTYAVSISGPTPHMQGENLKRSCELLLELKKRLTGLIGYSI